MAPGSTGEPYDTIRAPVFLWQAVFYHQDPRSFLLCRIQSPLLPLLHVSIRLLFLVIIIKHLMKHHVCTKLCYFFSMTGVNASCILPWNTSFPVVIIAAFLTTNGFISRIGPSSHMCEAASSLSFFMTSGMILVPASLSPFSQWYCRASLLSSFHQRS